MQAARRTVRHGAPVKLQVSPMSVQSREQSVPMHVSHLLKVILLSRLNSHGEYNITSQSDGYEP